MCVPSKLTKLRTFPLRPEEAGLVYYSKPSRDGSAKRHKVRPRVVFSMWKALTAEPATHTNASLESQRRTQRVLAEFRVRGRPINAHEAAAIISELGDASAGPAEVEEALSRAVEQWMGGCPPYAQCRGWDHDKARRPSRMRPARARRQPACSS